MPSRINCFIFALMALGGMTLFAVLFKFCGPKDLSKNEKRCFLSLLIIICFLIIFVVHDILKRVANEGTDGLDDAEKEAARNKYSNFALLAGGTFTLLIALFGYCGAKKENQCLLSIYSVCVFIILLFQFAAIFFINFDIANTKFVKDSISREAEKIGINVETLDLGSKFNQNMFLGVSAGLSAIVLIFSVALYCRAGGEERARTDVEA